jgi:hypothetical protein
MYNIAALQHWTHLARNQALALALGTEQLYDIRPWMEMMTSFSERHSRISTYY